MKENKILQEDIEDLVKKSRVLKNLKDATVFVTGATGLIGSHCVFTLMALNQAYGANIRVLALVRSRHRAEDLFAPFLGSPFFKLIIGDVLSFDDMEERVDYIIHGASATDSLFFVEHPVDTIITAVKGTERLLDLARKKEVQSMVYLSSLEVYGVTDPEADSIGESDYGYLDPVSVRSSYSESKRLVETLCTAYYHQYQVPVRMARLSQTFGPGVSYSDNRVFAQFARAILEKKDIVLKTKGETVRNYCYTKDAVEALFYILLRGKSGQAYNVANKETAISIRDMAEMAIASSGSQDSRLVFDLADDLEKLGYNPTVKIRLNTEKLEALGWQAETGIKEMFRRLLQSLRLEKDK